MQLERLNNWDCAVPRGFYVIIQEYDDSMQASAILNDNFPKIRYSFI